MNSVSMLDLKAEWNLVKDEVRPVVLEVLESQQFIGGPAIAELETALASRVGANHAIAVSNGTDAVLGALMALELGAGDEVILPTFTFFATAGSVARVGATPVFVDIDPHTFNLDPMAVEAAITDKTKAILAVHLFGQCAEMDAINALANKHGLKIIEDAAQAIDATYQDRKACSMGDVACMSFYPTKNLGGFGEGGMIFVKDNALAERIRLLRNHGQTQQYIHEFIGGNFRLDTMKAAILQVKLKHLGDFTQRRCANAARYDQALMDSAVTTPPVNETCRHVYHQYSLLCDSRDELKSHMQERGVGSGIYYPLPLHLQPCFASLGYRKGSMPVAENVCQRILSIPCHPMMSDEDIDQVVSSIKSFIPASTVIGSRTAQSA